VLDLFPRLKERLSHGGQQLSGGEQQMLSIGRALMTNPDCLILDEATEGLAPKIVHEIWNVIATIRATGIASIVVDRNYRAVLAHADRVVVLEKGLVVMAGPPPIWPLRPPRWIVTSAFDFQNRRPAMWGASVACPQRSFGGATHREG
jgi:ABC-type branched-subunit amino acid transport system ATPase component